MSDNYLYRGSIIDAYWHEDIPVNGIIKWNDHHCLFKLDTDECMYEKTYTYKVYHSGFGKRVKNMLFRKNYEWELAPICGRFSITPSEIVHPNGVRPLHFKIEEEIPKDSCRYGHCYLLWDGKFFDHDIKTVKEAAKSAYKRITTESSFDPNQDFGCFWCFQSIGLDCRKNDKCKEAGYEFRNGCLVQNVTVQFYHYLNQLRNVNV